MSTASLSKPDPSGKKPALVARLVVFDTHLGSSAVALSLPVTGLFSKIGMAARDDGSFVIVGAIADRKEWVAFQFRLDGDHPVWNGAAFGTGFMLNDPFFSDAGLLLPVQRGASVEFVELGPKAFLGHEGCSRL